MENDANAMLQNAYRHLVPVLWLAWAVYWIVAARDVKATARRESIVSRMSHIGPLLLAALLLFAPWPELLRGYFMTPSAATFATGTALLAAGLVFAVWARIVLGRNWSGTVTLKHDHELVRRGPYAWVRHPIYTGLLAAFAGTAIALAQWRGILTTVIVFVALWRKLRIEERWMGEMFGAAYARYRREVAALIPFLL